jgi:hypothetical protein
MVLVVACPPALSTYAVRFPFTDDGAATWPAWQFIDYVEAMLSMI